MRRLPLIAEVEATVARIVREQPEWPCRRGCDDCCRALAEPMRMSEDEWALLRSSIASLDAATRDAIASRLPNTRVCAMLDPSTGACLVYSGRPIACREYGFYAGRDGGRWCAIIEQLEPTVMLGNHDRLQQQLDALGPTRTLSEWWSLL